MDHRFYRLSLIAMNNETLIANQNQTIAEMLTPSAMNQQSYYRSKLFTMPCGVNPLINAATVILSLVSRLRQTDTITDTHILYEHAVHEIKAFEHAAQKQGYRSESILVARYVVCATLDEIILNTHWGQQSDWEMHKLLATFQKDSWGGERFFLLLDRLKQDAHHHLDLLELMYVCLCLGFQGKYRAEERGDLALREVQESLYRIIQLHRGEFKKELSELPQLLALRSANPHTVPTWLVVTLTLAMLLTIFTGFNYLLGSTASPLLKEMNYLLQEVDHESIQIR